ncbi:MAG: subclass B1 metallo-beta-lactamase [Candidatus Marinimicrobia bacterium]|nr:subclass B1 metallo-beta-lactamase [Candidatus Neomarinimicrobiota bacterium]
MRALTINFLLSLSMTLLAQALELHPDVELIHISDSVYVHTTWENSEQFGRFPSNGMIIIKNSKAVMIDTPVNNEKTRVIYDYLLDSMHVKIEKHIAGHFHTDCIGGLEFLHDKGVKSIASNLTIAKCQEDSLEVPNIGFETVYDLDFYGKKLECRFYGGGHSFDNIVVWLPQDSILFGGCLIKSAGSQHLGYLGDAVVDEWDATVEKVMAAYPNAKIVVPGHGPSGGKELMNHTISLVREKR